jgi:hypothetical protein
VIIDGTQIHAQVTRNVEFDFCGVAKKPKRNG